METVSTTERTFSLSRSEPMVCTRCGTEGAPKSRVKGSVIIELVLWLCSQLDRPGLRNEVRRRNRFLNIHSPVEHANDRLRDIVNLEKSKHCHCRNSILGAGKTHICRVSRCSESVCPIL